MKINKINQLYKLSITSSKGSRLTNTVTLKMDCKINSYFNNSHKGHNSNSNNYNSKGSNYSNDISNSKCNNLSNYNNSSNYSNSKYISNNNSNSCNN